MLAWTSLVLTPACVESKEIFLVGSADRPWSEFGTTPGGVIAYVEALGDVRDLADEPVFADVPDSLGGWLMPLRLSPEFNISSDVLERGGTLSAEDLDAYRPIERQPVGAEFLGSEVLTNPPPSAGGVLIAYSLAILERLGGSGVVDVARALEAANLARSGEFAELLGEPDLAADLLSPDSVTAGIAATDRLGSTTHLAAIDSEGLCASVTCSNAAAAAAQSSRARWSSPII